MLQQLGARVEYGFMEKADEAHTMIRLATAWSTTEEQTRAFLRLLDR